MHYLKEPEGGVVYSLLWVMQDFCPSTAQTLHKTDTDGKREGETESERERQREREPE